MRSMDVPLRDGSVPGGGRGRHRRKARGRPDTRQREGGNFRRDRPNVRRAPPSRHPSPLNLPVVYQSNEGVAMADHDGIEGLHGAGALQPPAAVPPGRHGTYASWPPAGTPIGSGWPPAPYPAPYPAPVATKSAGIAVLLSFLWPGLGHLYVGQIGAGVALICAELGMVMFS